MGVYKQTYRIGLCKRSSLIHFKLFKTFRRAFRRNSLNNHILQQSCFFRFIYYLIRRDRLFLTTIYKMLSTSSINISQYLFVQRSALECANEPLINIQIADEVELDAWYSNVAIHHVSRIKHQDSC